MKPRRRDFFGAAMLFIVLIGARRGHRHRQHPGRLIAIAPPGRCRMRTDCGCAMIRAGSAGNPNL